MGRKSTIPIDKASDAIILGAMNATSREIADIIEISQHSVVDIFSGKNGWRERLNDRSFPVFRAQIKKKLQAAGLVTAAKALRRANEELPNASAYQAAGIYGLLRDHERKDAGEATQHVAVVTVDETRAREAALKALMESMQLGKETEVEVEATPVCEVESTNAEANAESNGDSNVNSDGGHNKVT